MAGSRRVPAGRGQTVINPMQQHDVGLAESEDDAEEDGDGGSPEARRVDSGSVFKAMEAQAQATRALVQEDADLKRGACATFMLSVVRPDHPARLAWDVYILVLVVYSSLRQPYMIAFLDTQAMTALDWSIDISFYLDIVLNFWTGFDRGFEVILDKRLIAKNYLRGWFVVDLLATVEWELLFSAVEDVDETSAVIRMARLLKVLRLARMGRLISRLTANWTVNRAFIEAAKFFFYVASESPDLVLFVLLESLLKTGAMSYRSGVSPAGVLLLHVAHPAELRRGGGVVH